MINDPKQIVTPFAFEVHPDLLGLPLATPRRRLAALLLDLLIASILTALGAFFLATSASILFFWLAIRNRGAIWWKNLVRYGIAAFVSILVFALTLNFTDGEDDFESTTALADSTAQAEVDWWNVTKQFAAIDYSDSADVEEQIEKITDDLEASITGVKNETVKYHSQLFEDAFTLNLRNLGFAISRNDTVAIDTLKEQIIPILASSELNSKNERISKLNSRVDRLKEDNEVLEEQVENPGFLRTLKGTAEDFGLSVGWIGIYFVLCTALFRGQTLGKRILSLRVVRLNNKPIGLLYSFERFGGYAAGIATGLLGFAQVYWDANRQAIHDKIAATVVLDTRKKTINKYDALREEILCEENLLD